MGTKLSVTATPYPTIASRIIPWLAYVVHQFAQWYFIHQALLAKDRGEIGWGSEFRKQSAPEDPLPQPGGDDREGLLAPDDEEPGYKKLLPHAPNRYAQKMFALNMWMLVLKVVLE